MSEQYQLGYLVSIAGLFFVVPLVFRFWPLIRRIEQGRLERLAVSAADWLRPAADVDPDAADLYRVVREEQLLTHIRRLQRILLTDESMSATRQLGNRLAYDWLIRELDRLQEARLPVRVAHARVAPARRSWRAPVPVEAVAVERSHYSSRLPTVEVLEIRWNR